MQRETLSWEYLLKNAKETDQEFTIQVRNASNNIGVFFKNRPDKKAKMFFKKEMIVNNESNVGQKEEFLSSKPRNKEYSKVMTKNYIKVTDERLSDYRSCLKEIIDAKNGKIPSDSVELLPQPVFLFEDIQ